MAGVLLWMQACVLLQISLSGFLSAAAAAAAAAAAGTSRNYYETLSLEPTATDSQIKKNFRKLSVKYHPDKNKSADAEKAFREIAEAYQVLSKKEKRRLYDSVGHEAFLKSDAPLAHEDDHDDGFPFSLADFFPDFDEGPFVDETFFHWSRECQHYSFDDPAFGFFFEDEDENYF